jgi:SAM-dependent methyltransferase
MTQNIKTLKYCEVCFSNNLKEVLDLGEHPLCDDLVAINDERRCELHPIKLLYCSNCCTVHQQFPVPKRTLFPRNYHYRSRFTGDVLSGMLAFAEMCERKLGSLKGKKILDIGCNDGSLLDYFKAKGAITIGVEPTDAIKDAEGKGHHLLQTYFATDTAAGLVANFGHPDIVTFTNVFAHIEDLPSLLSALKVVLGPSGILIVENHYLGAVISRFQFDTFYHEHPRTYSLKSFRCIAETLHRQVSHVEFPSRYGGNIRVVMTPKVGKVCPEIDEEFLSRIVERERHFGDQLDSFPMRIKKWRENTRSTIDALLLKQGPLVGKAFPGRAAILVRMLELDRDCLEIVFERPGSKKIGHYIPGTRIPIDSDDELFRRAKLPGVILNLAWHIEIEITNYLRERRFNGEILNVLKSDCET